LSLHSKNLSTNFCCLLFKMDEEIEYPRLTEKAKAKFRNSQRGCKILIDPLTYQYHVNKKHREVTNWSCILKSRGCPGTCVTDKDEMIIRTGHHNHDPDPLLVKIKLEEEKILELAKKHPRLSTAHLMAEWKKATMGPAEESYLITEKSMKRKIQRVKQKASRHLNIPQGFSDLVCLTTGEG